jgi:glycosyltransferase involved in cell wall biosynthesis
MLVAGITQVRNEFDNIEFTIYHHLQQGLDFILVSDNGSTDGTLEVLRDLSKKYDNIILFEDDGPFHQSATQTFLAREAYKLGCDWVVPFDGDELWLSQNSIKKDLESITASSIKIEIQNFVQKTEHSNKIYADVQWKIPSYAQNATQYEIENKIKSNVELPWTPKHIIRTSENLIIHAGAHQYENQDQNCIVDNRFIIFQVPIRSYEHLVRKGEQGIRLKESGYSYTHGWECHRWGDMLNAGQLHAEWVANSESDGVLTRYDGSTFSLELDKTIQKIYNEFLTERK